MADMDVQVFGSIEAAIEEAANLVESLILQAGSVLGLAAGATMKPLYSELARRRQTLAPTIAALRAFLLDEYVGLAPEDSRCFRNTVVADFASQVGLPAKNIQSPQTSKQDLSEECRRYEASLLAAGVDLQLLGIGVNGHIGFNEPGSSFDSQTRVVELSEQTRQANAHVFAPDPIPTQAITQGIGTILQAKQLLLLAFESVKAAAIQQALKGPLTTKVPASALRRHPKVTVLLDTEAASLLSAC